jgi:medium-chain acyl-[acyl-carrier-protein] hydrolase
MEPDGAQKATQVRIFCLPHAGGTALHYRHWGRWLPDSADVVPVDMPGHGTRVRERLITDWQLLVDDLTDFITARIDGPCIVVGHSLGALLAYEVVRTLQNRGLLPLLLVVACRNGPTAGLSHRPIHGLPDAQFLAALTRLGGTPPNVIATPALLGVFLPLLRSDLRLAEIYAKEPGPPLACPIAAFGGRQDPMADGLGLLAWERETTDCFDLTVFDGGHFLMDGLDFSVALKARLTRLPLFALDVAIDGQDAGLSAGLSRSARRAGQPAAHAVLHRIA